MSSKAPVEYGLDNWVHYTPSLAYKIGLSINIIAVIAILLDVGDSAWSIMALGLSIVTGPPVWYPWVFLGLGLFLACGVYLLGHTALLRATGHDESRNWRNRHEDLHGYNRLIVPNKGILHFFDMYGKWVAFVCIMYGFVTDVVGFYAMEWQYGVSSSLTRIAIAGLINVSFAALGFFLSFNGPMFGAKFIEFAYEEDERKARAIAASGKSRSQTNSNVPGSQSSRAQQSTVY